MNLVRVSESKSVWTATEFMPKYSALTGKLDVDVCIVGGGIAGLTSAYLLQKAGLRVCVLEAFELSSGQTARTTAHFTTALDDRYFAIAKYHGHEAAKLAAESHRAAIDKVIEIVEAEKIECDLEIIDGYLFADGDSREGILDKELKAIHKAGLTDVELTTSPLNFYNTGPCLRFTGQMQLHPLKYLKALAKIIAARGGHIFTGTHVGQIEGGKAAFVKTDTGAQVNCASIVVATNTPVNDLFTIHTKQAPYRTYVLGFQVPKGSIPKALYWDTLDPYHYIRLNQTIGESFDVLIVGGEDHKTGQEDHPEHRFSNLESWTRERFPMATEILYKWSGQVMEPIDGMAFLGRNPLDAKNVYVITGDSGNGMTHCTIGAMLITDQIMGRPNPWEKLYDPSRISLKAAREFIRENVNMATQYADWISVKKKPGFPDLAPNSGSVYREGVKMIAAYKDEVGKVEFLSAACTHLAGVVTWNDVEKSWDCPCHGSRFDKHGKVIEGPAIKDLKPLTELNRELSAQKTRLLPDSPLTEHQM